MKYKFPIKTNWRLTTDFEELRPLSKPLSERNHKHGAWDIATPEGTSIYAPEDGLLVYHQLIRMKKMHHNMFHEDELYAFRNYFYDIFGGLLILYGKSGLTHVFCHIEGSEIQKRLAFFHSEDFYKEFGKRTDKRFFFGNLEVPLVVNQGDFLGLSGNAGYSTGPHIHYEIHYGRDFTPHNNRPNPKEIWPILYEEHKGEII